MQATLAQPIQGLVYELEIVSEMHLGKNQVHFDVGEAEREKGIVSRNTGKYGVQYALLA